MLPLTTQCADVKNWMTDPKSRVLVTSGDWFAFWLCGDTWRNCASQMLQLQHLDHKLLCFRSS